MKELDNSQIKNLENLLEVTVDVFQKATIYKDLARYYQKIKLYDKAHEYYEASIDLNPCSSAVFCDMGFLFLELYDVQSAHSCFEKCLDLNPQFLKAWLGLALIHYYAEDLELAWSNLEKVFDLDPLNSAALSLGFKWCLEEKCLIRSLPWLFQLSETLPTSSKVWLHLAKAHYELSFYGKASIYARKCLELNAKESEAHLFL